MKNMQFRISLEDQARPGHDLGGQLFVTARGITITFDGYGDSAGQEPILIEVMDGQPHVVVWSDITQEEPTHRISLEHAVRANRVTVS